MCKDYETPRMDALFVVIESGFANSLGESDDEGLYTPITPEGGDDF